MRFLVAAVILAICVGCEQRPTAEDVQKKREAELPSQPSPAPKFGDRLKEHKNPLA